MLFESQRGAWTLSSRGGEQERTGGASGVGRRAAAVEQTSSVSPTSSLSAVTLLHGTAVDTYYVAQCSCSFGFLILCTFVAFAWARSVRCASREPHHPTVPVWTFVLECRCVHFGVRL